MRKTPLTLIPNIKPLAVMILKSKGIKNAEMLLETGSSVNGRRYLLRVLSTPRAEIIDYICSADLLRIKGLSTARVSVLRGIGVDTVNSLSYYSPEVLLSKWKLRTIYLYTSTGGKRSVHPSLTLVKRFILQARQLPKIYIFQKENPFGT